MLYLAYLWPAGGLDSVARSEQPPMQRWPALTFGLPVPAAVQMFWHPQGDYLAVQVDRYTKTRKSTYTSFEVI